MSRAVKHAFGILAALIVISVVVAWRIELARQNDLMYSLRMLNSIKTMADLEAKREFFTPKGYELSKWMGSKCGSQLSSGPPPVISAPQFNSDGGCDVWYDYGDYKTFLHFVKGKYWQFDDMCLYEGDGCKIETWMSNYKDHPISTTVGGGLKWANEYVKKHMIEMYFSLIGLL